MVSIQTVYKLLTISALMLLFVSCKKIITLDVNNAAPALVIEGEITDQAGAKFVRISKTVPVGDPNVFPGVSKAIVTVSDGKGRTYPFIESAPGVYKVDQLKGIAGYTYSLKVITEGKTYTASSVMPVKVPFDSLTLENVTIFTKQRKNVQVHYNDPVNQVNNYHFIVYVNGQRTQRIYAYNDDFNNGKAVVRTLSDSDLDLKFGDKVEVVMECVDIPVYKYWYALDQLQNKGPGATTPANPPSNISNDALGYFGAHTVQAKAIEVL